MEDILFQGMGSSLLSSNSRNDSHVLKANKQPFPAPFHLKRKKCWRIRLCHTRIAWRVSEGLSLEPGTSKEKQSLLVLCSGVCATPLWLVESLCILSAGSDTEQRWDTDPKCCFLLPQGHLSAWTCVPQRVACLLSPLKVPSLG